MTTRIKKWVMSAGILGITFLFVNSAFSWTNDLESYLDSMSYYNLQVDAVITDMYLYSPVLFDAFLRWRTLTQGLEYGMSNFSKIPNWEYNKKRKRLIEIIKTYTKEHPDDIWARKQIKLLLFLPNISRGGLMGNSNLIFWGKLYLDMQRENQHKRIGL